MLAIIAPVPTSSSGSESSLAGPKSSSPSYSSPSKLSSEGSVVSAEVCPSTSASVAVPRTNDRGIPTGQQVPGRQSIPTADACFACGQKGHHKGSKECPTTPEPARLHAIGTDAEVEGHTSAETTEPSEDNFEAMNTREKTTLDRP